MSILLLTNQRDLTTDFLVRELRKKGVEFYRLNTDGASQYTISINPLENSIEIFQPSFSIELDKISAAYFRRPTAPHLAHTANQYREYLSREWGALLDSLYSSIGERWFSSPDSIFLAEDKPRQLRLAKQIGFLVPETVVTNRLEAAKAIQRSFPVIAKPLRMGLLNSRDDGPIVYTSSVESLSEDDRSQISACPVIFQRHIEKMLDIRVTVVGSRVFSCAIFSQESDETKLDWRRGSNPALRHEIFDLPSETESKCVEIVRSQNLRFGAIDLIQDEDGKLWFLECNPNGQWAWIENRTGLPIASAIADELIHLANV